MSLVRNEQTKLLANALDRASTACFTVGIATPVAGIVYDFGSFRSTLSPFLLVSGIGGWLLAAFALHFVARKMLKGLKP